MDNALSESVRFEVEGMMGRFMRGRNNCQLSIVLSLSLLMLGIFRTHDTALPLADNQAAVWANRFAGSADFHDADGAEGADEETSEVPG